MPETFNRYAGETRDRIIRELKDKFRRYPKWEKLAENIFREYPQIDPKGKQKRFASEAIVVSNLSNNQERLSPDNFVGNYYSFLTKIDNLSKTSGFSVEWVREDTYNLHKQVLKEDVSDTVDGNKIFVSNTPIIWANNSEITYNPNHVEVFFDGARVHPRSIDPKTGEIAFSEQLPSGTYEVSYWYQNLESPGLYQIEITKNFEEDVNVPARERKDFEFVIHPVFQRDEALGDSQKVAVTSDSATYKLTCPVLEVIYGKNTKGFALQLFRNRSQRLVPGQDYTFDQDENTVEVFFPPVVEGDEVIASYRTQGETRGPFRTQQHQFDNQALRGVVIAFSDQIKEGDKVYIEISNHRSLTALTYGGLWQIGMDFTVFAKDPYREVDITKFLHRFLEIELRPALAFDGIELEEVNMGSESTDTYLSVTEDPYYTSTISINCKSFWERREPIYGSFVNTFPDVFFVSQGDYFSAPQPSGSESLIVRGNSNKYNIPKNYPSFTGRNFNPLRRDDPKNENKPQKIRTPKANLKNNIVGFF